MNEISEMKADMVKNLAILLMNKNKGMELNEALAIIFMVVQVAGSGGTFPIDVLPKVYRMIYRYLPFPYAMDALRETIGGMYGNYYWECIGRLFIYIIIPILIGLVLRKPFEQLNHYMERSKENSGVML